MFQIGVSGRGGQGVGTAAGLLAVAAFIEGKYARAFPGAGPRPLGAPVVSFCRISDTTVRPNEPVTKPDALIIQDPSLLHQPGLLTALDGDGYLLINSMRGLSDLGLEPYLARMRPERLLVLPATQLSLDHLGQPLPGAALLGGFAALAGQVGLDSVAAAISERFISPVAERNVAAATAAFGFVEARQREFAARVGA